MEVDDFIAANQPLIVGGKIYILYNYCQNLQRNADRKKKKCMFGKIREEASVNNQQQEGSET